MTEYVACDYSVAVNAGVEWECGKTRANRVARIDIKEGTGRRSTKVDHLLTNCQVVARRDGESRKSGGGRGGRGGSAVKGGYGAKREEWNLSATIAR